jgi:hypothetical protein
MMHRILKLSIALLGLSNLCLCLETDGNFNKFAVKKSISPSNIKLLKKSKNPSATKHTNKTKKPKSSKTPKAPKTPKGKNVSKGPKKTKKIKKTKGLKFSETFNLTYIVYSSNGFNAETISKNSTAQEMLTNVLKLTLVDIYSMPQNRRKLNTVIGDVIFENAIAALSTFNFSTVKFSAAMTSEVLKNESEVQTAVNDKASKGHMTSLFEEYDPSKTFGFSAVGFVKSAVYNNVLRFNYECDENTNIEHGLITALRRWHELLNIEYEQGFSDINIIRLNVTNSECIQSQKRRGLGEQNVRVLKGTAFSLAKYIMAAKCTGECPEQGIAKMDGINDRRRLEKFPEVSDKIPLEREMIDITTNETNVPIQNVTTDETQNKIVGCLSSYDVSNMATTPQDFDVKQCNNQDTTYPTPKPSPTSVSSVPSVSSAPSRQPVFSNDLFLYDNNPTNSPVPSVSSVPSRQPVFSNDLFFYDNNPTNSPVPSVSSVP